jgi:hypothetical protein
MFEKIASINWLAVLAAGFAMFTIGGVWYGAVFANLWKRLNAHTEEVVKQMQAQRPPAVFFGTMIGAYVVGAAAMALLVVNLDLRGVGAGLSLGIVLWLFGTAAIGLTDQITRLRPFAGFALDSAFQIVAFPVAGLILTLWR